MIKLNTPAYKKKEDRVSREFLHPWRQTLPSAADRSIAAVYTYTPRSYVIGLQSEDIVRVCIVGIYYVPPDGGCLRMLFGLIPRRLLTLGELFFSVRWFHWIEILNPCKNCLRFVMGDLGLWIFMSSEKVYILFL